MQTQEGFPLVTEDGTPTIEVHVFSKEWALQGEGYNPQYFDKGRCRPAPLPVAMAAQASHVSGNIAFTAYCIHVNGMYRSSMEGVEGGGLAVLRLDPSIVYAAAGASLQQCAQNCHDGWEAQKGPEVLFKYQHRLWCRVGS